MALESRIVHVLSQANWLSETQIAALSGGRALNVRGLLHDLHSRQVIEDKQEGAKHGGFHLYRLARRGMDAKAATVQTVAAPTEA